MFGIFKNMFAPTDKSGLEEAVKNGGFLVDVRTPAEFSAGSVKRAVNILWDKVPSKLSKFRSKKSIIVFCRSGSRSYQTQRILENNGFKM
jgi:rhodanese-related sulfurtransferase